MCLQLSNLRLKILWGKKSSHKRMYYVLESDLYKLVLDLENKDIQADKDIHM